MEKKLEDRLSICHWKNLSKEDNWKSIILSKEQQRCIYNCNGYDTQCNKYISRPIIKLINNKGKEINYDKIKFKYNKI